MEFEWDESKATTNLKKRGVSFNEAENVFDNALAVIFDDEAHSEGEKREIIIGHSQNNRLLMISFAERPNSMALRGILRKIVFYHTIWNWVTSEKTLWGKGSGYFTSQIPASFPESRKDLFIWLLLLTGIAVMFGSFRFTMLDKKVSYASEQILGRSRQP